MVSHTDEADGTPGGTRTPDLLLRRQLLYPAELLAYMERVMGIEPTPTAWKAVVLAVILHPQLPDTISLKILPHVFRLVKIFLCNFKDFREQGQFPPGGAGTRVPGRIRAADRRGGLPDSFGQRPGGGGPVHRQPGVLPGKETR